MRKGRQSAGLADDMGDLLSQAQSLATPVLPDTTDASTNKKDGGEAENATDSGRRQFYLLGMINSLTIFSTCPLARRQGAIKSNQEKGTRSFPFTTLPKLIFSPSVWMRDAPQRRRRSTVSENIDKPPAKKPKSSNTNQKRKSLPSAVDLNLITLYLDVNTNHTSGQGVSVPTKETVAVNKAPARKSKSVRDDYLGQ